jgi:hypothetical protein
MKMIDTSRSHEDKPGNVFTKHTKHTRTVGPVTAREKEQGATANLAGHIDRRYLILLKDGQPF